MRPALLLLCALLASAEPPPVPDPYDLGERLALIDCLRETYGLKPAAGAQLAELRAQYAAAWAARSAPVDDDPGRTERLQRLRERLATRHQVEADPALDETALQELLHRLDAERAERDRADVAGRDAAERVGPRQTPAVVEREPSTEPPAAPTPSPERPAPTAGLSWLDFKAPGVSQCLVAKAGDRTLLLVTFGQDHNGAFTGIREGTWATLSEAPAIRRSVLMLGHGAGASIAGESIAQHLAANKAFYETMGGTQPAAPLDCLVLAACAGGGQAQMAAMREGLGYFPTWRVATGSDASTTRLNVLAALHAVAGRPARPAWRGMFRLRMGGAEIVSFGDVGEGGERAETTFWRIVQVDGSWKVEEQR